MKINGEAIYGTRMYTVFGENDSIHFTQSKDKRTEFIFLSGFPENKVIITKIPFEKNTKVQMLGSDKKLSWKKTSLGVEITIPQSMKKSSNYTWVLKISR
jgi:alpha-L-fucosidase